MICVVSCSPKSRMRQIKSFLVEEVRVCSVSRGFKALTDNGRSDSVKYPPLMRSNNEQRDERRPNQVED
jgi:hypothetical protein